MRRTAAAALAAVLLLPLAACANDAATSHNGAAPAGKKVDGPTVKIMVGGLDKVIYMPAMLTQRLGYFADAGVNVELLSEPAGVNATTALLAGDVQGAVGFYDHTIDLQAKGKIVESVVQFSQAPGEVEVVSAKQADAIKSGADFKGRKLGVTSIGSSTDFLTKYLAVKNGVNVSEFSPIAVGAGQTFIAALQQGSIDAGMTTDPTVANILSKQLGTVLYDMRTPEGSKAALGGLYPSSSLYMNTAWVDGNKETVQKLANAFVKTLKWMNTHTPEEIAAQMPADYAQGGAAEYAAAIKATLPMFTTDGVMPADGPKTVLSVLAAFHPDVQGKEASIDLAKTYTTEFVSKATG
ncbi:ABC transporter substrate-binding protein [Kitasatospora sp. YST-16]|uniref:ABC transporter substrate-binding protein n=1 Tax=unclassified Kitasatospora TaxID=2633591 RepID=UPI0004C47088|nr:MULTISPECIES: ABC transporter substrate-binding protein [unclassified Kitasatospora]WAL70057.1 ABC transporter substrate-binding protein [Kitasatospora sp. YST-16]WAL76155.1 ABC transporter substrate-binding protein [Kitasatospora sp. YST-16]WNW42210.1 ABC transporter substrate-binding protein [Streptomyces sp. Li-HN-5-13]